MRMQTVRLLVATVLAALLVASGVSAAGSVQATRTEPDTLALAAQTAPQAAVPRHVYLTFDDGPHPQYTAQVLDVLSRYRVLATFFEVGQNVTNYPALTRRAHLLRHSVQNHTWSHPDLRYVSGTTFTSQVRRTDTAIRARTGYTPRCLRPPYGGVNSTVRSRAAALGKTIMLWTVDPRDWSRPGSSVIARRVLDNVRSGSVILLHDGGGNRSQTVAALPTILRTLKARGYVFYRLWCG